MGKRLFVLIVFMIILSCSNSWSDVNKCTRTGKGKCYLCHQANYDYLYSFKIELFVYDLNSHGPVNNVNAFFTPIGFDEESPNEKKTKMIADSDNDGRIKKSFSYFWGEKTLGYGDYPEPYNTEFNKKHPGTFEITLAKEGYKNKVLQFTKPELAEDEEGYTRVLRYYVELEKLNSAVKSIKKEYVISLEKQLVDSVNYSDAVSVEASLIKGADINWSGDDGWTALFFAANSNKKDIVQILIKNRADINSKDKNGLTPLMGAAHKGFTDVVNILIENGADVNAVDQKGYNPLLYALKKSHKDTVNLLAKVTDVKNSNGAKAIVEATDRGYTDVVRTIIEKGVDVSSSVDECGRTPLQIAVEKNNKEIEELLRKALRK